MPMNYSLHVITIGFFLIVTTAHGVPFFSPCGTDDDGWVPYLDQKCFKIVMDTLLHEDEAENVCRNEIGPVENELGGLPPLITINNVDEQEFLTKFIFEQSAILDNVWLGASFQNVGDSNDNEINFQWLWADGSAVKFTNWREGSPSNDPGKNCSELVSKYSKNGDQIDTETEAGEWTDVPCLKRNVPVCQKLQTWSFGQLQKKFMDFQNDMVANPVPVGFIYIQLPFQAAPQEIWPKILWTDVTPEYAGLFFRAEGNGAGSWESVQDDSTRKLGKVQYTSVRGQNVWPRLINVPEIGWSETVMAAAHANWVFEQGLSFYTENVEVRPKNMAMRIWRRSD